MGESGWGNPFGGIQMGKSGWGNPFGEIRLGKSVWGNPDGGIHLEEPARGIERVSPAGEIGRGCSVSAETPDKQETKYRIQNTEYGDFAYV